ncbi:DUF29 family protein [Planktothrix sp.]|uniref:DUF29 family protein n=1 Tax=Planktothrix sp. TaxID=3088171 RepID=UPI0038D3D3E0
MNNIESSSLYEQDYYLWLKDTYQIELELLLKSKTLYNYFLQEIEEIYSKARKQVIKKTDLPAAIFPEYYHFKAAQLLDSDFLP